MSLANVAVLVAGRPGRVGSLGRCDWLRVRFRGPFEVFAAPRTPLVKLGLEPADVVPGRCLFALGGDEEGCGGLTPFTPAWDKGGGGRFIFAAWEVGLEIAVAMMPALATRRRARAR